MEIRRKRDLRSRPRLRGGNKILKKWSFPKNLALLKAVKFSQKRILFVLAGIVMVILVVYLGVIPLSEEEGG
jgi:hypothetical protein